MAELSSIISLSVFPTGRRLFALRGVQRNAEARGLGAIADAARTAAAFDEETMRKEHQWIQTRNAPSEPSMAPALDQEVDRLVGSIHAVASAFAGLPDNPLGTHAANVLAKAFAGGVQVIVQRTHEEQAAAVDVLLEKFAPGGELGTAVDALGLRSLVEQLGPTNARFQKALVKAPPGTFTFDKLAAARAAGQDHLLEVVALVLGHHWRTDETEARAALLAPVFQQEEDIRAAKRRRRHPADVDPSTGEAVGSESPLWGG